MTPEAPIAEIEISRVEPRDPAWTFWDILLVIVIFVLALMASVAFALGAAQRIPHLAGNNRQALLLNPLFFVPVQFVAYLITFIFTRILITLRAQNDFWTAVKWNPPRSSSAAIFAFGGANLALAVQLASSVLPIPKSLPMDQYFRDAPSAYIMAVFGILVAPLVEELLFR